MECRHHPRSPGTSLLLCSLASLLRPSHPLTANAARQIFRREHFFRGRDNEDQLLKIVKVLGTDEFERYLTTYGLYLQTYNDDLLQRCALYFIFYRARSDDVLTVDT